VTDDSTLDVLEAALRQAVECLMRGDRQAAVDVVREVNRSHGTPGVFAVLSTLCKTAAHITPDGTFDPGPLPKPVVPSVGEFGPDGQMQPLDPSEVLDRRPDLAPVITATRFFAAAANGDSDMAVALLDAGTQGTPAEAGLMLGTIISTCAAFYRKLPTADPSLN
jgi:hypothetical protein